jgi:hypothetical protein
MGNAQQLRVTDRGEAPHNYENSGEEIRMRVTFSGARLGLPVLVADVASAWRTKDRRAPAPLASTNANAPPGMRWGVWLIGPWR